MELKVSITPPPTPNIQFNLHWIVHIIEISAFSQSRCHYGLPEALAGTFRARRFGNFITLVDNMAKFS